MSSKEEDALETLETDLPSSSHLNLEASEVDQQTSKILRGDQIGDTAYSQSFVIKTLLLFNEANFEFSKAIEQDLCALWDMTEEEDVCLFLKDLNFFSLACEGILTVYKTENRIVEIIIGMLANCLIPQSIPDLSDSHKEILISFIDSEDPLILIQLMRLLKTLVFKLDSINFVTAEVIDKILFFLQNSLDENLLEISLNVFAKLLEDEKLSSDLLTENIVSSCCSAMSTVVDKSRESEEEDEEVFKYENVQKSVTFFVQIIIGLGAYFTNNEQKLAMISLQVKEHEEFIRNALIYSVESYKEELNFNGQFYFLVDAIDFIIASFKFRCEPIFEYFFNYCELEVDREVMKSLLPIFKYTLDNLSRDYFKNPNNLPHLYKNLLTIKMLGCRSDNLGFLLVILR